MTQYEKQFYEVIIRELPKISKSLQNISRDITKWETKRR